MTIENALMNVQNRCKINVVGSQNDVILKSQVMLSRECNQGLEDGHKDREICRQPPTLSAKERRSLGINISRTK